MMGRELISPGGKQIKALLSAALHHTIAYINILSRATQVGKGLARLYFHKGRLSTPWPPLLSSSSTSSSSSQVEPAAALLLTFLSSSPIPPSTRRSLSQRWTWCFPSLVAPLLLLPRKLLLCLVWTPSSPPNISHFLNTPPPKKKKSKYSPSLSRVLILSDADVSLADRRCRGRREKQDSADRVENVTVIYGVAHKSRAELRCIRETSGFFLLKMETDTGGCLLCNKFRPAEVSGSVVLASFFSCAAGHNEKLECDKVHCWK